MKWIKMDDETYKQLMQWKLDYDLKRVGTVVRALILYVRMKDTSLVAFYRLLHELTEAEE